MEPGEQRSMQLLQFAKRRETGNLYKAPMMIGSYERCAYCSFLVIEKRFITIEYPLLLEWSIQPLNGDNILVALLKISANYCLFSRCDLNQKYRYN